MTEALKDALGEGLYNTLKREVGIRHPGWVTYTRVPRRQDLVTLITPEGVAALAGWTVEDFDRLHTVGPGRAQRIYEAVNQIQ